jgi:hypothetical protein
MKVALNTFARAGIEAHLGRDLTAGVQAALQHYTRRLHRGGPVPDFPRFCRARAEVTPEAEFELAVDRQVQEVLEREARERAGVSVEQLAGHAVLVYLADLDREAPERGSRPLVLL